MSSTKCRRHYLCPSSSLFSLCLMPKNLQFAATLKSVNQYRQVAADPEMELVDLQRIIPDSPGHPLRHEEQLHRGGDPTEPKAYLRKPVAGRSESRNPGQNLGRIYDATAPTPPRSLLRGLPEGGPIPWPTPGTVPATTGLRCGPDPSTSARRRSPCPRTSTTSPPATPVPFSAPGPITEPHRPHGPVRLQSLQDRVVALRFIGWEKYPLWTSPSTAEVGPSRPGPSLPAGRSRNRLTGDRSGLPATTAETARGERSVPCRLETFLSSSSFPVQRLKAECPL